MTTHRGAYLHGEASADTLARRAARGFPIAQRRDRSPIWPMAGGAMRAPAPTQRLPFPLFTRDIPEFLGNLPFTLGGQRVTMQLDQVGYGDMLVLHVRGTYTVATAALVFRAGAPWDIITVTVQPPGQAAPVVASGKMLHYWNLAEKNWAPFVEGHDYPAVGLDTNAYDAANQVNVFPTAVGAQTAHLWYVVPLHRSSQDVRGILPLGNKSRTTVAVQPAAAADLVTVPANLTVPVFSIDVFQVYYTAPPAGLQGAADPDPFWAVTYEEQSQNIAALGDQVVNIEPNDSILGVIHFVIMNDLPDSADLGLLTLRVNKSYYFQGLDADYWLHAQRRQHRSPFPTGVIVYNFDRDVDSGPLDNRRWVHSQDVQTIQSTIGVPTGTIGTRAAIVTSVKRLIDLNPGGH